MKFKFLKTPLVGLTLSLSCLVNVANAGLIDITFGGIDPGDGSVLTSSLTSSGYNDGSGIFWEDFDNGDDCGFTQLDADHNFGDGVTGSYSLTTGHTGGQAAPPAGDKTCYLATPKIGEAAPGSVDFGIYPLLTSGIAGIQIDYLGIYWGSIDGTPGNMDSLTLFDQDGQVIVTEFGDSIDGDEILEMFKGQSGDQHSELTNLYVNFHMSGAARFNNFSLSSSGKALEVDNIVARVLVPVPEPSTLAIFALGMIGLVSRRLKKQS